MLFKLQHAALSVSLVFFFVLFLFSSGAERHAGKTGGVEGSKGTKAFYFVCPSVRRRTWDVPRVAWRFVPKERTEIAPGSTVGAAILESRRLPPLRVTG